MNGANPANVGTVSMTTHPSRSCQICFITDTNGMQIACQVAPVDLGAAEKYLVAIDPQHELGIYVREQAVSCCSEIVFPLNQVLVYPINSFQFFTLLCYTNMGLQSELSDRLESFFDRRSLVSTQDANGYRMRL